MQLIILKRNTFYNALVPQKSINWWWWTLLGRSCHLTQLVQHARQGFMSHMNRPPYQFSYVVHLGRYARSSLLHYRIVVHYYFFLFLEQQSFFFFLILGMHLMQWVISDFMYLYQNRPPHLCGLVWCGDGTQNGHVAMLLRLLPRLPSFMLQFNSANNQIQCKIV